MYSINEYKEDIDNVKVFLNEALIKTNKDKDRISIADLSRYYNLWSEEQIHCIKKFGIRINNHITTDRKKDKGNRFTCICGYVWKLEFKNKIDSD